jgi:hypothetical protein
MDDLVLPFIFVPDGHPDAALPPPPGWITLRATLIPDRLAQRRPVTQSPISSAADRAFVTDGGTAPNADELMERRAAAFAPAIPAVDLIRRMTTPGLSQIPALDTIGTFVLGR